MLLFDKPSETGEAFPLYEGMLANRYDHRAKTYAGYDGPNKYGVTPGAPETKDEQKSWAEFEIEPRYWMHEGEVKARYAQIGDKVCIGFRDVGAP